MIDDAIYLRKGKGRGKSPEDTMKKIAVYKHSFSRQSLIVAKHCLSVM